MSQTTAQFVIEGLLETALNKEDHEFFKEIAKRNLVLFLVIFILFERKLQSSTTQVLHVSKVSYLSLELIISFHYCKVSSQKSSSTLD